MENIDHLLQSVVDELGVKRTDIGIGAGGAMVIHKLTNSFGDIDISIKKISHGKLIGLGYIPVDYPIFGRVYEKERISVHIGEKPYEQFVIINGWKVWSLECLLTFYENMLKIRNKPADLEKVKILRELINP